MAIISVPKPLRDKLGEEGSDAFIDILNKSQEKQRNDIIEIVAEKFGHRLSEEISGLRTVLKGDNAGFRAELKEDIAGLRTELKENTTGLRAELKEDISGLRVEMHSIHADLIKWMFIFCVGQVVTTVGILLAFFR